jgi:transcriptional regulator with XRE-family HTH domain
MNNLKEIRLGMGLNQYDVSNKSGVHQSRISLIENGYVTATLREKTLLAEALNCLPEELFGPNPLVRLVAGARV